MDHDSTCTRSVVVGHLWIAGHVITQTTLKNSSPQLVIEATNNGNRTEKDIGDPVANSGFSVLPLASTDEHPAELMSRGDEVSVERTRHAVVFLFARECLRAVHDALTVLVLDNVRSRSYDTLVNRRRWEDEPSTELHGREYGSNQDVIIVITSVCSAHPKLLILRVQRSKKCFHPLRKV